jgi:hypothetical protein
MLGRLKSVLNQMDGENTKPTLRNASVNDRYRWLQRAGIWFTVGVLMS